MAATPRAPRPLRPLLLCCLAASARAALVVPQVFSDGCVLQTNAEYGARSFIFGAASPGDAIVVELRDSASHQPLGGNYSTVADAAEGAWRVTLNPLSDAMAPFDIVVSDETTGEQHVASGCLAGDIYVNSGQSNIVFQASDALNASALWNASWPNVRLFAVQMTRSDAPQRAFPPLNASLHCSWSAASALPCTACGKTGNSHQGRFGQASGFGILFCKVAVLVDRSHYRTFLSTGHIGHGIGGLIPGCVDCLYRNRTLYTAPNTF
jgi:hypothetical protein